ncbi:MFS transporter [Mycobacterium haemophilum]|uniref:Metabolite transporter n=1 Tax=Mycobacterium haemophilum TaxID=29311 RepID=A0A0I9TI14_9MYCO|nr:MFS transporter [Mycobacterium haemophilum]KLO27985.1 metabolite transporter [Mycobacterium haemophilum]KLO35356.1 metabolite transporter [Mycobacterium haemophilum]KLO40543.1 metabolite transporter [Mycobacterium haemophilum]KLO47962.1 metabolite transporter [Mycobacterium haemophilum]
MNPVDVMDVPAKRGFRTRLLIACCGGPFLDGYVMSIIGVALPGVAKQLNPTATESGLIGAASLIGMFLGASVFGFLTDRIGREKMYALDLVVLVMGCALSVFVTAPWQLIVLRFVIGAAIGADYPIATSLLTEFTPSQNRGFTVGMSAVAWSAGAVFAYIVGALFIDMAGDNAHWRLLLATSAALGMIVILLRRGIPESPRWLVQTGRFADAEAVIKKVYGITVDVSFVRTDDAPEKPKVDLRGYFRGEYLRRLTMCSALYLAVVTPLYALLTFLPTILSGFAISGDGPAGLMVETSIIGLIVAGSILALYLVERCGRRPVAVSPLGIMVIPLAGLWLWAGGRLWFIVAMFCIYAFVSGGPSILVWIYPNELFPTEFRATAVGIAISVSRVGAATGTYLLPLSIATLGAGTTMLFGAILTAAAFVICLFMAPETKGKSLEEISSSQQRDHRLDLPCASESRRAANSPSAT